MGDSESGEDAVGRGATGTQTQRHGTVKTDMPLKHRKQPQRNTGLQIIFKMKGSLECCGSLVFIL